MICPNCNRTYDDNFNFCPYCRAKKPELKICPICEFKTYKEFIFCPKCSEELISEIDYVARLEKIRIEEERKDNFRKIVENEDLTLSSKQTLYDKINNNKITDVNELKKEIQKEEIKKKEEQLKNELKNELKKCVSYCNLYSSSKQTIYQKIKNSEITNVYELNEYLKRNGHYYIKNEIDFIIEKGTLYGDFCTLINIDEILIKNETKMSKEELLTTLDSFRGEGRYMPAVFSKLTKLIKDGSITTYEKLIYTKLKLENGPYEKDPNITGHPNLTHTQPIPAKGIYRP